MPIEIGNVPAPLTITHRPKYSLLSFLWDAGYLCFLGWILYSSYRDPHRDWVTLVFLAFGAVGVVLTVLYRVSGSTQLEFSFDTLTVRICIMGIPQRSIYRLSEMGQPYWAEFTDEGGGRPHLEFDYGGQEIEICGGMSQAEAEQAIAAIRDLYPEMARRWDSATPLRSKVFTTLGLS